MLQNAITKTPATASPAADGDGSTEKPAVDGFSMLLVTKPVVPPEADRFPAISQKPASVEQLIGGAKVNGSNSSNELTVSLTKHNSYQTNQTFGQHGTAKTTGFSNESADFMADRISPANAIVNSSISIESKTTLEKRFGDTYEPANDVKLKTEESSVFTDEAFEQNALDPEREPIALPTADLSTLGFVDSELMRWNTSGVEVSEMTSVYRSFAAEFETLDRSQEYTGEGGLEAQSETASRMVEVPIVAPTREAGHATENAKLAYIARPVEVMVGAFQMKLGDAAKFNPAFSNTPSTIDATVRGEPRLPTESAIQEPESQSRRAAMIETQSVAVLRNEPPTQISNAARVKPDVSDAGNIAALQSLLHADTNTTKQSAVTLFQNLGRHSQTLASAISENSNWSSSLLSSAAHTTQSGKADGSTLQTMRVQLNPVELGKVDLNLRMQQGQLQIMVRVENDQAHRALLTDQETLISTLRSLGYKVDNIVINGPGSESSTQNQDNSLQDEQRNNSEKNEHRRSGRSDTFKEFDHDGRREETAAQDTHSASNII